MNQNHIKTHPKPVRPLPYYTVAGGADEGRLAAALRSEFIPKVKRLLPGHHLGGFRHDFIVNFVRRHKKKYPCFIRTDIRQFYPRVRHRDIVVGMQVAYRDLLGMDYVPQSFKKKYVGAVNAWCKGLPLHRGIPLGSPLSAILAPVMLLPLWLQIKRRFGVPFIVYQDDVLICTTDDSQSMQIYAYIENYLSVQCELELNTAKTTSGRFSRDTVEFCGWRFAGGYATISPQKQQAFKERITTLLRGFRAANLHAVIKRLNHKIDGFGHYYKFGNVAVEFRRLDMFVRTEIRKWFARAAGTTLHKVKEILGAGLHSLFAIHDKMREKRKPVAAAARIPISTVARDTNAPHPDNGALHRLAETMERVQAQLMQLVSMERKQVRMMEQLLNII